MFEYPNISVGFPDMYYSMPATEIDEFSIPS